uniref:Uncharacterized protein n=1 Tax=Anguilla anguilla TaxID=7936 RepID=A0A0E9VL89_ANGAN
MLTANSSEKHLNPVTGSCNVRNPNAQHIYRNVLIIGLYSDP